MVSVASLFLFIACVICSVVRQESNTQALSACLGTSNITALVPSDTAYAQATLAYNRRLRYSPFAVVYPTSPQQIQQIIQCAAPSGIPVVARSGGHSYAAFGLGGQDGSLVIDLSKLKSLSVDQTTGYAISQTGNLLGDLATGIWENGQRALPHGTCPYVGTGGHASYGGFGLYSRVAGLLLDRIVEAEVVLADGSLVTASSTSNPDLFWALRGAAPSFGIVTSWTFSTLPAPPITINYQYAWKTQLSQQDALSVFVAFQNFVASLPRNELSLLVFVSTNSNNALELGSTGSFYGTEAEFVAAIKPYRDALPGNPVLSFKQDNWIDGLVAVLGPLNTTKPDVHDNFLAKSLHVSTPFTNDTISTWLNFLVTQGSSSGLGWWAQFDMYGGYISTIPEDATSYAHRNALYDIQFYGAYYGSETFPDSGITFMNNMVSTLAPNPEAAYPNYADPTLTPEQWHALYYGSHFERLTALKRQYDPNNVFSFPQSIPVTSEQASLSASPSRSTGTSASVETTSSGFSVKSGWWGYVLGLVSFLWLL